MWHFSSKWPNFEWFSSFDRRENNRKIMWPQPKRSVVKRETSPGLSNLLSTWSNQNFGNNKICGKNCRWLKKTSAVLSKLHPTCPQISSEKKMKKLTILWKSSDCAKVFWILSKIFEQSCQNCILHVQRNFLVQEKFRQGYFVSDIVCKIFQLWPKIFDKFVQTAFYESGEKF